MKRLIYFAGLLSILMFACSIPGTPTPVVITPTPTATQPSAPAANVNCNELSLHLEPALGSGASCETVPASGGPDVPGFETYPQYTKATLQGYVLADRFFTPQIAVYPVQAYRALVPDLIQNRVKALQDLIGGGPLGTGALPLLPIFNAMEEIHVQYKVVPFRNGSGIRYLTQYTQFADPINNYEMFYSFQGLTADGQYWVSAILPISSGLVGADSNAIPGGMTQEQFSSQFESYRTEISNTLNAADPNSFAPAISALDNLIGSINIQP